MLLANLTLALTHIQLERGITHIISRATKYVRYYYKNMLTDEARKL